MSIQFNPYPKLFMTHNYDKLMLLLYSMPEYNTPCSRNKLSDQIFEYKTILDSVNQTNDFYHRNTNIFYAGINVIERDLYYAKQANSDFEKDQAFTDAVKALRSNIKALSAVINPGNCPHDVNQIKSKHEFVDRSLLPKNHLNVK